MHSVLDLGFHLTGPLGTIIHLGASSDAALADYAGLTYRRLILVEGDPRAEASLRSRVRGLTRVEVVGAAVTPDGGTVPWFRCSLPHLNGTVDPLGLQSVFPRMRSMGEEEICSRPIGELLREYAGDDAAPDVLVLDVPGLEDALLSALTPEQVAAFNWILIRGCAAVDWQGADAMARAVHRLSESTHRVVGSTDVADPFWPVTLLKLDAERLENVRLSQSLQRQDEQITELRAEIADLHAERAVLLQRPPEPEPAPAADIPPAAPREHVRDTAKMLGDAWLAQRHAESRMHAKQVVRLQRRIEALSSLDELKPRLESDLSDATAELQRRVDRVAALEGEVVDVRKSLAEASRRGDDLQLQFDQSRSALSDVQATLDEVKPRLEADLRDATAELQRRADRVAALEGEVASLQQSLAEASRKDTDLQLQLDQSRSALVAHHDDQQQSAERFRTYSNQMLKAETQLQLIKDLLLRGPSL